MVNKQKILIVDDDREHCRFSSHCILPEGMFDTMMVHDGKGFDCLRYLQPNSILLDLMLPGIERLSGMPRSGQVDMPYHHAFRQSGGFDKVLGLELGADDYMMEAF